MVTVDMNEYVPLMHKLECLNPNVQLYFMCMKSVYRSVYLVKQMVLNKVNEISLHKLG